MSARHPAPRSGFTIAECLVAVTVFAVGVLGLAGTLLAVQRLTDDAANRALAASLASSRYETMRAAGCGGAASGNATWRGLSEQWTVASSPGVIELRDSLSVPAAGGRPFVAVVVTSAIAC